MANEENLIKAEDLTPRERRENASKAGKASVAARRRKKNMQQKMKLLLSLKPDQSQSTILEALGIPEEDADNEMLLLVSMFQAAVEDRDTKAFDRIMDVMGKTVQREELALRKKELAKEKSAAGANSTVNIICDIPHEEDTNDEG